MHTCAASSTITTSKEPPSLANTSMPLREIRDTEARTNQSAGLYLETDGAATAVGDLRGHQTPQTQQTRQGSSEFEDDTSQCGRTNSSASNRENREDSQNRRGTVVQNKRRARGGEHRSFARTCPRAWCTQPAPPPAPSRGTRPASTAASPCALHTTAFDRSSVKSATPTC